MVRKIPTNASICLLQVVQTFLFHLDTSIYSGRSEFLGIFNEHFILILKNPNFHTLH